MTEPVGGEFLPANHDSVGDAEKGSPPKIDLRNALAIHRELARVYRDMRSGKIQTQDGTRLAFVLNLLRQSHEATVLEKRIQDLEQRSLRHGWKT